MSILYVDLAPIIGGSIVSLEQLLGHLDRTRWQPTAALASGSPAVARIRALGIPVIEIYDREATPVSRGSNAPQRQIQAGGLMSDGRHLLKRTPLWPAARSARDTLLRTLPVTWQLQRAVRQVRADLVHANDALFISRPAIAAAWLARTPVICHVRSLGPLSRWDRLWARSVRQFIYISNWVAADLADRGIPAARGRVIHNGVDMALYRRLSDRSAARSALGLPLDRPIVAVVARLERWKGQDLFLQSLRQVADAVPDVLGLVVGDMEGPDRAFAAELRSLAASLRLAEAVRFTGYCADMPTLLAAIDVLAHTSVAPEPFGRVLVEAMAAGRPVVSPAEGGGLEIVADGITGLLYTPRDSTALAAALLRLLRDPATATAMGQAGQARAAEHFSIESHVLAVEQLYRELIA